MTPELILYNYPLSPFSEKIRTMLGYTQLPWYSVKTTAAPPRPFIDLLAGGYRRIPVAQIGADIYCDTRTITTQIARLTGRPELALENCSAEINEFVEAVEPQIFFACVMSASGPGLVRSLWSGTRVSELLNALRDRMVLNRTMKIRTVSPRRAGKLVAEFCDDLEARLDGHFLFGANPTVADFAAYHGLWFIRDVGGKKKPWRKRPRLLAWLDRMRALGHGECTYLEALAALDVAMSSEPAPLPAGDPDEPLLGRRVLIGPADYGLNTSCGRLVASTEREWIIARETAKTGLLHVHFPRHGFEIRPR